MNPERITCAVCQTPVQRTEWWDERETNSRVLRVHCHGATQEMRLTMKSIELGTLQALEHAQGVAFETVAQLGKDL